MQTYSKTHAKIILMGEHSVVYNQPSIALPIKNITASAALFDANEDQFIYSKIFTGSINSEKIPEQILPFKKLIKDILKDLINNENYPFKLKINSDIPIERGMGSSAAISSTIVKEFYHHFNKKLNKKTLLEKINFLEKLIHGNSSGIDSIITNYNKPIIYVKNKKIQSISFNLNAFLIIADSGIHGRTKDAVKDVQQLLIQDYNATKTKILNLGILTKKTIDALKYKNIILLGNLMNDAQKILKDLSVSSKELDNLIKIAQESGSLGSKLTGGGRGGCIISLSNNINTANYISKNLIKYGAKKTWIIPLIF